MSDEWLKALLDKRFIGSELDRLKSLLSQASSQLSLL